MSPPSPQHKRERAQQPVQAPGQGQLPAQPSERPSAPVQFLHTTPFTPGRVSRGRSQPELPDQPKLKCQSFLLNLQPAQGVARCLAFRPGMTPLDDQASRRAVDQILARLRQLGDQLGSHAASRVCWLLPSDLLSVPNLHALISDVDILQGLRSRRCLHRQERHDRSPAQCPPAPRSDLSSLQSAAD